MLPSDPAQRFLNFLIEDMADEWGTKCMFHYRWFYAQDQDFCSKWIAGEWGMGADYGAVLERAAQFRDRQVGRMAMVGCTPENRPVIEETYLRVLRILGNVPCGGRGFSPCGAPARPEKVRREIL